ncbi:MAG TPA: DUF3301 domain-containing protein [Povalibacter sp.]
MLLSWTALALLIAAAAVAWFWQDSLAARERANTAAMEACERLSLQFLDGTVAFARIGWSRGSNGWVALRRTYVFDYTANSIERLQGFVVLLGHRVESVGYAPGQEQHTDRAPTVNVTPSQPPPGSNVLDLDQWRTSHRQPTIPATRESREDRGDRRH